MMKKMLRAEENSDVAFLRTTVPGVYSNPTQVL
jgi:hypothetical protein